MGYWFYIRTCFVLAVVLGLVHGDPAAGSYGPGEFGSLTLCPPGGRAFMMAWSLACEMKRKKRSIPEQGETKRAVAGYRPATLTEIQRICCDVGCEIRDLLSYCDPFGPWNS